MFWNAMWLSWHLYLSDCENNALQEKVKVLHAEEETRYKVEQTIKRLEAQIAQTQLLLDKEKAKYQSAWRQQEVSTHPRNINLKNYYLVRCRNEQSTHAV